MRVSVGVAMVVPLAINLSGCLLWLIVDWFSHLLLLLNLVVSITNLDQRNLLFWKEIKRFIRIIALREPLCQQIVLGQLFWLLDAIWVVN